MSDFGAVSKFSENENDKNSFLNVMSQYEAFVAASLKSRPGVTEDKIDDLLITSFILLLSHWVHLTRLELFLGKTCMDISKAKDEQPKREVRPRRQPQLRTPRRLDSQKGDNTRTCLWCQSMQPKL